MKTIITALAVIALTAMTLLTIASIGAFFLMVFIGILHAEFGWPSTTIGFPLALGLTGTFLVVKAFFFGPTKTS